jgi:tripartite-type tricarboxylate transporter receptor subunit TctC
MGLLVPVRTPRAVIDKLHSELVRIAYLPDVKQKLQLDAAEPVGSTPEQFATLLKAEVARWTKVVKAAGIRAD